MDLEKNMSNQKDIDPFETPLLENREEVSPEEAVSGDYILPNIETKLPKRKRDECREIVKEIRDFGVSQRQLLYTIYLLSLELENVTAMRALAKVIGEVREQIPANNLHIAETTTSPSLVIEEGDGRQTNAPPSRKKLIL